MSLKVGLTRNIHLTHILTDSSLLGRVNPVTAVSLKVGLTRNIHLTHSSTETQDSHERRRTSTSWMIWLQLTTVLSGVCIRPPRRLYASRSPRSTWLVFSKPFAWQSQHTNIKCWSTNKRNKKAVHDELYIWVTLMSLHSQNRVKVNRVFFPHPTSIVSTKFPHVPLGVGGCPLGYEEWRCWATCPCN